MYNSKDKMVSHPSHYQTDNFEVIDIIEEFTKNLSGIEATDTGNVIKYILRWDKKGNPIQDLEKAQWYLTHLIDHMVMMEDINSDLESEEINIDDLEDLMEDIPSMSEAEYKKATRVITSAE